MLKISSGRTQHLLDQDISIAFPHASTGETLPIMPSDHVGSATLNETSGLAWLDKVFEDSLHTPEEPVQHNAPARNAMDLVVLGVKYTNGSHGVEKDQEKAVDLLLEAHNLGSAEGTRSLGRMYEFGYGGLTRNIPIAKNLYTQAAEKGDRDAHVYLGDAYYNYGTWLKPNSAKARECYEIAAAQGSALGNFRIGSGYFYFRYGFPFNQRKAFTFWSKAAELGNTEAQNAMAHAHETGYWSGVGPEKDRHKALQWLIRSASQGSKVAEAHYKRMMQEQQNGITSKRPIVCDLWPD